MNENLRISPQEISSSNPNEKIIGISAFQSGPLTVLKFAYDTGDSQIVYLDDRAILHLVAILKTLVPTFSSVGNLPLTADAANGGILTSSQF
ncbi:MAG: hypothetical protein ACXWKC_16655 [Xanthobacteraceae bacterium]